MKKMFLVALSLALSGCVIGHLTDDRKNLYAGTGAEQVCVDDPSLCDGFYEDYDEFAH